MGLPHSFVYDAYGAEISTLLKPLEADLALLSVDATARFYEHIASAEEEAQVLGRLLPDEYSRLRQRQAKHIALLLSSDLTQAAHQKAARITGAIHALVGVEVRWVVEACNFYQDEIYTLLSRKVSAPAARELLMRALSQRFLRDLEGQVDSYHEVATAVTAAFAKLDRHVMSTGNLTDLVQGALAIIGGLPGDISAFFARVDLNGELQIEQFQGSAADKYQRAMERGAVPKLSIDPRTEAGRGPGGRAWRRGEIGVSDAWGIESDTAPWREVGTALGFRSSAAVPLLDESGRSMALLSLYSAWPGFFSADRVRGFLSHVQQMLSHAVQQRMSAPVVPLREQQAYRQMLEEGRLVMLYQPVIDLSDGALVKVEALARIVSTDGECISPQRFLPALGGEELLMLFEQGIAQVCEDIEPMRRQGVDTRVAVNFPAEGFDDTRYEQVLFKTLENFNIPPVRVQLEVLETRDGGINGPQRRAFMQRLIGAGVQIAQDDLGSGHSSLLRLDQYPFDEVKIDQGLVRGALQNPKRAVEFMLHLTRLAHAFSIPVTVEGLENTGMIEAAAILGADWGQGYGIAKPAPLEKLIEWNRGHTYTIDPNSPKTAIGALAGYLLWEMQLASLSETPEFVGEFVGAKALVTKFIETNNLQDGPIYQLLERKHELAATTEGHSKMPALVRDQLISALTDHWLAETGSKSPYTP